MNVYAFSAYPTTVGMTAFGYGKPENFSGYLPRYSTGMYDFGGAQQVSGYIFDTTSKYISSSLLF